MSLQAHAFHVHSFFSYLFRPQESSTVVPPQTQLPSPATSQLDLAEQIPAAVSAELNLGTKHKSLTPLRNSKRKRSRSEAQDNLKHPHRARRLQTVPTALPSSMQRSASPEASFISALPSNHTTPPSESVPHIPSPTPVLPNLESSVGYGLLSQAEIPEFSSDFPDPPTCDQLDGLQAFDLTLFNSTSLHAPQSLAPSWGETRTCWLCPGFFIHLISECV